MLPLAAKLLLTLYMGKYLSLAEMGVYGLVFGAVSVLRVVLCQGFDYVVTRDIVGATPLTALHKMRDQAVLYSLNYGVLIVLAIICISTGAIPVSPKLIVLTVLLTILEGYASALYDNANSMNQQLTANFILFIRTGLWVFPVVLLGWIDQSWRTAEVVLCAWLIGATGSLALNLLLWRAMPWGQALRMPVDWDWIRRELKKCLPIWLGGMGATAGLFVDRFLVERFLTLDDVGVLTFFFSFSNALGNLMQSGVLSFAYPRLIAIHREGDNEMFRREARQAIQQMALGGGGMALLFAIAVPILGVYTGRPAIMESAATLWLMLLGVWIRLNSETLNFVLYARRRDRAIWQGNLLFLIPAIGGNAALIPLLGLPGVGWASVLAAVFIFIWRWWRIHEDQQQRIFFHAG
ncbi:hypothetical protein CCR94_01420 [Rhodoblastus sphagnicola]|uniref:Polysaccharide biosynthesis protein C-terminal domain-containing protein n=1 Tax=Rhodoblastus sphagnicola TaxID=333368 RepID=A0A2S6NG21_9HYPH|nr:hypothetical protein CCR94_01420 [Rhodoblastus sphagnicola]